MIEQRMALSLLIVFLGVGVYFFVKWQHGRKLSRLTVVSNPTLLYFSSESCMACPTQTRYLDRLAAHWSGRLDIRKIDADKEPEKASAFRVFTLPTTILLDDDGSVREINYGLAHTQKLNQQVAKMVPVSGKQEALDTLRVGTKA